LFPNQDTTFNEQIYDGNERKSVRTNGIVLKSFDYNANLQRYLRRGTADSMDDVDFIDDRDEEDDPSDHDSDAAAQSDDSQPAPGETSEVSEERERRLKLQHKMKRAAKGVCY
jgi:hypothetical protein